MEIIITWSTGKAVKLSPAAEEVATFYAKMLDHEYTTKDMFRKNFFKDWRKVTHVSTSLPSAGASFQKRGGQKCYIYHITI